MVTKLWRKWLLKRFTQSAPYAPWPERLFVRDGYVLLTPNGRPWGVKLGREIVSHNVYIGAQKSEAETKVT